MRKAALLAVIVVGLASGLAPCGFTEQALAGPSCYTAFWPGEAVRFKLVVPAEYFLCGGGCETPLITGWRVETLEGTIVYEEPFAHAPKGHWYVMTWNQKDACRLRVPPGFYRVVVETAQAGGFEHPIYIGAATCCYRGCCGDPQPCFCPCGIPLCQPYIKVFPPTARGCASCCSLSIRVHVGINCCP